MTAAAVYLRVSSDECRCGHGKKNHEHGACVAILAATKTPCACAGYTARQDEANQEPDCARICAARGWAPTFYRERISGVKRRPEWERLKEDVRRGGVRAVVFWAIDRTGRTAVQIAHDLEELWRWGADIASVQDGWVDQPPGIMRDLLVKVMAWFAESERVKLIGKTRAGLVRARAQGRFPGRPRVMPETARARALEFRRTLPSWTPGQIKRALVSEGLGVWPRATVRDLVGPAK